MAVLKFWIKSLCISAVVLSLSCAHTTHTHRSADDLFASASDNLRRQRFEEAKYEFNKYYIENPESDLADDALYRLGYIACVQNRYDDARGYFETLIEEYPKSNWLFDTKVWTRLLDSWASSNAELESVKSKLSSARAEPAPVQQPAPSEEIERMQEELERLREDNRKLRELIESME